MGSLSTMAIVAVFLALRLQHSCLPYILLYTQKKWLVLDMQAKEKKTQKLTQKLKKV
jgi:hypothetical protein